jgi:Pro-kumamolisin, activation domain
VSEERVAHPGSEPQSKAHFPRVLETERKLRRGAVIEVSVYVKREALTDADNDKLKKLPPHGPAWRAALHLLRHEKYARRGGQDSKIGRVHDFATKHGLSVTHTDPARRLVKLSGTVEDMAKAFGEDGTPDKKLALGIYTDTRRDDRNVHFVSHTGPLHLPRDVSDVVHAVLGLDNRPVALPRANRRRGPEIDNALKAVKRAADLVMPEPDIACWPSEVGYIYGFKSEL